MTSNALHLLIAGALILLLAVAGCTTSPQEEPASPEDPFVTTFDTQAVSDEVAAYPVGSLSEDERADLVYLQEEEKLARDVYLALYDRWGLKIFDNIGNAEQTHMDSVTVLIDRYGLENPMQPGEGVFADPELQALYTQLVAEGAKSPDDALMVGAFIEEVDIVDLQEAIARTDNPDILLVYENLMRGSRNHLRAFVNNIEARGGTYEPQVLSASEYQAIIDGSVEKGGFGAVP
jgi:hypothetical protein